MISTRAVKRATFGLSSDPHWHRTLEDLSASLHHLVARYQKPVTVVKHSDLRRPVDDIVFGLPEPGRKGAAIWEPLCFGRGLFHREGDVTGLPRVNDSAQTDHLRAGDPERGAVPGRGVRRGAAGSPGSAASPADRSAP